MPRAIPVEIRRLVVEAYKSGEGTYKVLSIRFSVGVNSVVRWVGLDKVHHNLSPRPFGGGVPPKINIYEYDELRALLIEKPDRTIKELAWEWGQRKGEIIHASSMSRALRRAGLSTKKKLTITTIATPLILCMVTTPLSNSNEFLPPNHLIPLHELSLIA